MNRKEFLRATALTLAAAAVGSSFLESCAKTNTSPQGPSVNFTVDLSKAAFSALNAMGGYAYSNGVVITRISSGTDGFIALSQTCTHQGCTIAYQATSMMFVCPCHGGTYDPNGNVTGGPPTSPVKKYAVTRSNNILTIKG